MKKETLVSVIVFLFLNLLHFASAQIGETCQKIPDATKPETAKAKVYFKSQVCRKAKCKPTLKDWKWIKANVFPKILKKLAKDEQLSADETNKVTAVMNDVTNDVIKACKQSLGKSNLCQDNKDVKNFDECIHNNVPSIVISRYFDVMPLVTEPMCQKHMKFLKDPKTWKKVEDILKEFSQRCKKM